MNRKYNVTFILFVCLSHYLSAQLVLQNLTLLDSSPAANSNQISTNSSLIFIFSESVDATTVHSNNFIISGSLTGIISGTFIGGGTSTITFTPETSFQPGESVTATLRTQITSLNEVNLLEDQFIQWRVATHPQTSEEFEKRLIHTDAFGASMVRTVDMDGDRDNDVLSSSAFGNSIHWYENDGIGNFIPHTIANDLTLTFSVEAADIDGDGDIDILGTSLADLIVWFRNDGDVDNDGDIDFTSFTVSTNTIGAVYAIPIDLDGDGDMDVVSAALFGNEVSWHENNGNEVFTIHNIATNIEEVTTLLARDMDNDGDIDIVSASVLDNRIILYENDGRENFDLHEVDSNAQGASYVVASDFDHDGDMDIAAALRFDNKVVWYERDNDTQGFIRHSLGTMSLHEVRSIHAADLDGNGEMDILAASIGDDRVVWFSNNGDKSFTPHDIDTNADGAHSVYASDIDGDGLLDVLSASLVDNTVAWYQSSTLVRLQVHCNGQEGVAPKNIEFRVSLSVPNTTGSDITFDIVDEGSGTATSGLDYVAIDVGTQITIPKGESQALFSIPVLNDSDVESKETIVVAIINLPQGFTIDDPRQSAQIFDDDGFHLLSSNPTSNSNHVARDSNLTFHFNGSVDETTINSMNIVIYGSRTGLIRGSFSGGGTQSIVFDPDFDFQPGELVTAIVTTNVNNSEGQNLVEDQTLQWTIATEQQLFGTHFTRNVITTGSEGGATDVRSVYGIDLDGDGDNDVISGGFSSGVDWYENDGSGNFTPHSIASHSQASGVNSVHAIDLDKDGDIDVLSASKNDHKINWYDNNGNENFTTRTLINSAGGVRGVYAIDLDGDGDMDIAATYYDDDKVVWLENDGHQSFSENEIDTNADGAQFIYVVDIDKDGDMDILATLELADQVILYINDGNENFIKKILIDDEDRIETLHALDVDDDGDMDVLSTSSGDTNNVSFLRNNGNTEFSRIIIGTADDVQSVYGSDFDGDGDIDVFSNAEDDDHVLFHRNEGNSNFTTTLITEDPFPSPISNIFLGSSLYTIDLDDDGLLDVLSAVEQIHQVEWYKYNQVNVPKFMSNPETEVTEGDYYIYGVDLMDAEGDDITLVAPSMPSWLNLSTDFVITWAGFPDIFGNVDGIGNEARFDFPADVAMDAQGNLYVAESGNNQIRKIDTENNVTTLAGSGNFGNENGIGVNASFASPFGLTSDSAGNVYVADTFNSQIKKIDTQGNVTTFAGSGDFGNADGNGANASFSFPFDVDIDTSGNLYVADETNHTIRKITPNGDVTTLAGSGMAGSADGNGSSASFQSPFGVAVDEMGNVYVADTGNHTIRKITPIGEVTTIAGQPGTMGNVNGNGTQARFNLPTKLTVDSSGTIYVADAGNHTIRKIMLNGEVSTLAGTGAPSILDGVGTQAGFDDPYGLVKDTFGNLYIADSGNHTIRKLNAYFLGGSTTGQIGSHEVVLDAYNSNQVVNQQSYTLTVHQKGVLLTPKIFLLGPYNSSTGLMNDDLRQAGFIPISTPYTDSATVDVSVFDVAGNDAIVDWVWVELRSKNDINTVLYATSGLLQRDGDVVALDGTSNMFILAPSEDYYVSVSHRNHIPIVTNSTMNLRSTESVSIDLTHMNTIQGTSNAVIEVSSGVYALFSGDTDGNHQVQTTDYNLASSQIGQSGYFTSDTNMDGQVQTTDLSLLISILIGVGVQF